MRLGEISGWQTARRDDAKVALEVQQTRAVDRVRALNEAAFFDELFHCIREIGAWPLPEQLDPADRDGPLYPFLQFVLLTIMRCVGGVQSMLATHELLLTDEALMSTLGFNAAQVEHGSTKRGLRQRTEPVEIRGVLSHETIADNIVKLGSDKLETTSPTAWHLMRAPRPPRAAYLRHRPGSYSAAHCSPPATYSESQSRTVPLTST